MKTIVVGGAGFIGSNIVDLLIEQGHDVWVIDNLSTGKIENLNPKAHFINFDIVNHTISSLAFIMKNAEVVFHLAALPRVEPSIHDPLTHNKINVDGTLHIFLAAKEAGVKKVIFSSSSSVYGDAKKIPTPENEPFEPLSPYALQKQIGEDYAKLFCKLYGMTIVCLRYFNCFGFRAPTEGAYVPVVGIWKRQIANGEPISVTGDGNQTRDFVNVMDVAAANILFLDDKKCPNGYSCFNVGSGKNYKILDLANLCSDNIIHIESRTEPNITCADITALKTLGWKPEIDLVSWLKKEFPNAK